jgi:hypothetical protein
VAVALWADAPADGRLDPARAAEAIITGVTGQALKLSRISDSLRRAAQTPSAARRVVEAACHAIAGLAETSPANLHTLIELAARLGTEVGVPDLPDAVRDLASRPAASRLATTVRQLLRACSGPAPDRPLAALDALRTLLTQAQAGQERR